MILRDQLVAATKQAMADDERDAREWWEKEKGGVIRRLMSAARNGQQSTEYTFSQPLTKVRRKPLYAWAEEEGLTVGLCQSIEEGMAPRKARFIWNINATHKEEKE